MQCRVADVLAALPSCREELGFKKSVIERQVDCQRDIQKLEKRTERAEYC